MTETLSPELLQKLASRRAQIEGALASLADRDRPVELDQTTQGRLSRMDAISQQQMARASKTHLQRELSRIDAALARADKGVFGLCCRCELQIEPPRLAADPSVPFCLDCLAEIAEERRRQGYLR